MVATQNRKKLVAAFIFFSFAKIEEQFLKTIRFRRNEILIYSPRLKMYFLYILK